MYKKSSSVTERIVAVCLVWFLPLAILLACGSVQKSSQKSGAAGAAAVTAIPHEPFDNTGEIAKLITSVHDDQTASEDPPRTRDRFDRMIRERHDFLDRGFRKQRDDFNAGEKLKRDRFMADLESARSQFASGAGRKADAKTRSAFSIDQNRARQDYFAAESSRHKEFEEQLRESRRLVDEESRDLNSRFATEYRALVARRDQIKASATPTPEEAANKSLIQEFKQIPKGPATPLGPGVE